MFFLPSRYRCLRLRVSIFVWIRKVRGSGLPQRLKGSSNAVERTLTKFKLISWGRIGKNQKPTFKCGCDAPRQIKKGRRALSAHLSDLSNARMIGESPATESVKSPENGSRIEISKGFRSHRHGCCREKVAVGSLCTEISTLRKRGRAVLERCKCSIFTSVTGNSWKTLKLMSITTLARNLCFYLSIFQRVADHRIYTVNSISIAEIVFANSLRNAILQDIPVNDP